MSDGQQDDPLASLLQAGPVRQLGSRGAGAGLTFGLTIVVFTLVGLWLDARLGTTPLCLLIGLALGGIGGFIQLVEAVSPGTLFRHRRRPPAAGGERDKTSQATKKP